MDLDRILGEALAASGAPPFRVVRPARRIRDFPNECRGFADFLSVPSTQRKSLDTLPISLFHENRVMFRFSKTVILTPLPQTDGDQKQISPFVREEILLVAILIGDRGHF